MIISRALFTFQGIENGKAKLQSVRFLSETMLEEREDILMVKGEKGVDFFLSGKVPLCRLSSQQFKNLSAASRFFGHFPGNPGKIPMWLCTTSLQASEGGVEDERTAVYT